MLRFITLLILFLLSLLTLFKAPAYPFWLAAILVSEYGWAFAAVALVILLVGFLPQRFTTAGTIVGALAVVLFLSPVVRAYVISKRLVVELNATFETEKQESAIAPFSLAKLFSKKVNLAYQTFHYASYRDTSLTFDYYKSQRGGRRPCVVVIHGGSWSGGDSQQLSELNSILAENGYHVVSVNYRLAPAYHYPAPVEDVNRAIDFLKQHARTLQIDTNHLVLLGRSAGGQIALQAAYVLPKSGVKAVIDFYGPANMVWGYTHPASRLVFDSKLIMRNYLGGSYEAMPSQYKASSPIEYVNDQTVPTLMIHGENDVLVSYGHSTRLVQKLKEHHIKNYLLSLPWATHGFDYNINGPGGQLSTYAVLRFLGTVTQ